MFDYDMIYKKPILLVRRMDFRIIIVVMHWIIYSAIIKRKHIRDIRPNAFSFVNILLIFKIFLKQIKLLFIV